MKRPARSPPACMLVRPLLIMSMFLPNSLKTASLPRWNPSLTDERITIEMTPQMIPNMVRKLRRRFAERFDQVCKISSRITARLLEYDFLAFQQAFERLGAGAVADPHLDRPSLPARGSRGLGRLGPGVALRVVDDGALRDDEGRLALFEYYLGVRGHVHAQLAPGIIDGDPDFEADHVVLLRAHRGYLRHAPFELLLLEGLDFYSRGLPEADEPDVGFVHFAKDVDLADVAQHHDEGGRRAHVQYRRDGASDLDIARQDLAANGRADRRVVQLFFRALDGRARLRDLRLGLRDARAGDAELRARDLLPVLGLLQSAPRVVALLIGDQAAFKEPVRALDVAAREAHVGAVGLDLVLLEFGQ